MKNQIVFSVFLCIFLALSHGLNVKPCSSSLKTPKNVEIKGCEKTPCKIYKGSNLAAEILFTAHEATSTLRPQLFGKLFGMKMPINLPTEHQNVCDHLIVGQCPLSANQDALYHVEVPILKSYPAMKTEIEVNLVGDNKKVHMCFKVDTQIV